VSTKHEGDAGLSSPFAPHPGRSVQIHMQRPTGYTVGADHTAALRHARKLAAGAAENAAWIAAHGGLARCRLHRDAPTHCALTGDADLVRAVADRIPLPVRDGVLVAHHERMVLEAATLAGVAVAPSCALCEAGACLVHADGRPW